ncbi:MAG: HAD-IC family P-type ATPase [Candidatus Nomurabacteria bacterium]|nr:HAD-IC family P-type ATPase [Candidatus Nomurabacteria bacterium]
MNEPTETNWYNESCDTTLERMETSLSGLSSDEVLLRTKQFGPNKLPDAKLDSFFKIILHQFQSPLIYVLMIITVIVFGLGEYINGAVIAFVLVFNAIIGAFQEGRAQSALLALQKFTKKETLVVRNGERIIIPSSDLVPGDIIVIREGTKIPSDARVIESKNLTIDEAILTGESQSVQKTTESISGKNIVTGDQSNMVFRGTTAVRGSGIAVVVATGIHTEIGKISQKIQNIDTDIPLKRDIAKLAKNIVLVVFIASIIIFAVGVGLGSNVRDMFLVTASLVVAVIPEGLPIVLTLVLANGVRRMAKQNVLVKRLQAVEALGQAKVLAVDKTGTLTRNELVVQKIFFNNKIYSVAGVGYEDTGEIKDERGNLVSPENSIQYLGKILTTSANAEIFKNSDETYTIAGDPTEAAMYIAGQKLGWTKEKTKQDLPIVAEIPFDYKIKYYANNHRDKGGYTVIATGALGVLLEKSTQIYGPDGEREMSKTEREKIIETMRTMTDKGLRVIGITTKNHDSESITNDDIKNMTFVGMVGMKDALRVDIHKSLEKVRSANIRVVMITGDHARTAQAIAKEAGIYNDGDKIITGTEIDAMGNQELSVAVDTVTVFARVAPEHKLRIINAFKQRKEVIAMTGDGVNDVPSLVSADLGVAMGVIGTDAAKDSSDIILLDDNFGNIAEAVKEGRNIYLSIKKILYNLIAANIAEMMVVTLAIFLTLPLPLEPVQIIWLNLVTDSILVLPLALEPRMKNLLSRAFSRTKNLIDRALAIRIIITAVVATAGTFLVYMWYEAHNPILATTMVLTTLVAFQIFIAWGSRSDKLSVLKQSPFTNPWLIGATLLVVGLQVMIVYTPRFGFIFETVPLGWKDWLFAFGIAGSVIILEEIRKLLTK